MKKLLKIRFVKFEHALVGQQIGVSGIEFFERTKHIEFLGYGIDFVGDAAVGISLSPARFTKRISTKDFDSNEARDEYLNKVVKWISEEQFRTVRTGGKLEIGEECEFSDDGVNWVWSNFAGKCAKQLGEPRFLQRGGTYLTRWKYVRPIASCVQPKIDGDVYTWEMEVGDEI